MQMQIDLRLRYPKRYVPVSPEKQIQHFEKLLNGRLDASGVMRLLPYAIRRPAENWFVAPKLGLFKAYEEAVDFMLSARGVILRERQALIYEKPQQLERTKNALRQLGEAQEGDFWFFPAQLGFLHRQASAEEVRSNYGEKEFGLDVYLAAACLVSHGERLTGDQTELGINCPGNEDHKGGIPKIPGFNSFEGRVRCLLNRTNEPNPSYGSATGFLPY